jgi:hypothetical protein
MREPHNRAAAHSQHPAALAVNRTGPSTTLRTVGLTPLGHLLSVGPDEPAVVGHRPQIRMHVCVWTNGLIDQAIKQGRPCYHRTSSLPIHMRGVEPMHPAPIESGAHP